MARTSTRWGELIWGAFQGELNGNCAGKTTSDLINRWTTKPVGGSRLSEHLVQQIYGGFQGCRADIYQACCKFRSALSQIYDLCFTLRSSPPFFPWEPQVLLLRFMEWFHTGWEFQPEVLNPCGLAAQTTMLSALSSISLAHLQNLHRYCFPSSSLCCCAASSLKSCVSTCIFNTDYFVSDKLMSHAALIILSILLKENLFETFTSYSVWT